MLSVAVGSTWTRTRKKAEIPRFAGTDRCPRCQLEPETPLHRYWTCSFNTNQEAYTMTEDLVYQATVQAEAEPAFWPRGLLPTPWAAAPPPAREEAWVVTGPFELGPGCLGHGTGQAPVLLFGDAS
eukprot:346614-Pyramimonas_sp.AAC.1